VTRIYSELDFCKVPTNLSCQRMINKDFPQAVTTYSFEYGAERESRQQGVQQLRDAIANLW